MKTIAQQLNINDFPFKIKDKNGNILYYEDSDGNWDRYEYDENGKIRYYENSDGLIIDNRVTTMTKEEAEKKFNIKIK